MSELARVATSARPGRNRPRRGPPRERFGLEALAVLGVSYGMSGLYALLTFIRNEVQTQGHLANAAPAVAVAGPQHDLPVARSRR